MKVYLMKVCRDDMWGNWLYEHYHSPSHSHLWPWSCPPSSSLPNCLLSSLLLSPSLLHLFIFDGRKVLGDSVSIGYTGVVTHLLNQSCLVQHSPWDLVFLSLFPSLFSFVDYYKIIEMEGQETLSSSFLLFLFLSLYSLLHLLFSFAKDLNEIRNMCQLINMEAIFKTSSIVSGQLELNWYPIHSSFYYLLLLSF